MNENQHSGSFELAILPVEGDQQDICKWPFSYFFKPVWEYTAADIETINGMSGGPLVAIQGEDVYLMGVQSHESTEGRKVTKLRACPVDNLIELIALSEAF